jgi:hypothetical protein
VAVLLDMLLTAAQVTLHQLLALLFSMQAAAAVLAKHLEPLLEVVLVA